MFCLSPASLPTENAGTPEKTISLGQIIAGELSAAENSHREFRSRWESSLPQRIILVLAILTNILFFATRNDYIVLFIAASFYLNMFYFITLLIPTNPGTAGLPTQEITRFHAWLRDHGITSGTRQFTRIFINTFFMNSRALTFGIGLIFTIDIVFTLIAYSAGLPAGIALFVIAQSAIIIAFYSLVWKVEPFTAEFARNIDMVRSRLSRQSRPGSSRSCFSPVFFSWSLCSSPRSSSCPASR